MSETAKSIRRYRETKIYLRAIAKSIIAGIYNPLRRSVATEVHAIIKSRLLEADKDMRTIRMHFERLGYDFATMPLHDRSPGSRREAWETHLGAVESIYKPADRMKAVYYWSTHHNVKSWGAINAELSLTRGVLLGWICQPGTLVHKVYRELHLLPDSSSPAYSSGLCI
jgi:hypothetical protein